MSPATPTRESDAVDRPADLDRIFGALSDRTRRQIIVRLTRGEATLTELAKPFDLTMPGLSKHVTVLQRAGIVDKRRRGRSHYCRLRPENLAAADEWLRTQTAFWEDRLDGLAAYLEDEDGEPEPEDSSSRPIS